MKIKVWKNNEEERFLNIEEIPAFDGYTFITFSYPDDKDYYEKFYIKKCLESWKTTFKNIRIVNILIDDEVIGLSKWTSATKYNKKYMTDSLRLYFVNKFDKCFYCDTDVFLTEAILDYNITDLDYAVANFCTGNLIWNKNKDNEKLKQFFDFYETEIINDPWNNNDVTAFEKFKNKYGFENNVSVLSGLNHFSILYIPLKLDTPLDFYYAPWLTNKKIYKQIENDRLFFFNRECFSALMQYILEHKDISLPDIYNPEHYTVSFF